MSTSNDKVSLTGITQSELNYAAANPLTSGMIESSTSETMYVSSDYMCGSRKFYQKGSNIENVFLASLMSGGRIK